MSRIIAHMTGSFVTPYGEEGHGWVDPQWSYYVPLESRNYANPVLSVWESDPDLAEDVCDLLPSGQYFDNGDGTFYGEYEQTDPHTGDVWTYAIHFTRKFNGPYGSWTETPWHPRRDGGIVLPSLLNDAINRRGL